MLQLTPFEALEKLGKGGVIIQAGGTIYFSANAVCWFTLEGNFPNFLKRTPYPKQLVGTCYQLSLRELIESNGYYPSVLENHLIYEYQKTSGDLECDLLHMLKYCIDSKYDSSAFLNTTQSKNIWKEYFIKYPNEIFQTMRVDIPVDTMHTTCGWKGTTD